MFEQLAALAPRTPWGTALLAGAIVGFGVIMTMSIRAKIAKKQAERPSSRDLINKLKNQGTDQTARYEAHALASELLQSTQEMASRLDNKTRRLETLMDEADRKILALSDAVGEPTPPSPNAVEPPAPEVVTPARKSTASPSNGASADPLTRAVYEHADAGLSPLDIARKLDEQVGKVELILALRQP